MAAEHSLIRLRIPLGIVAAAALWLWPALWNGYPIVFADTGTYLSQAIHRYAGWDRPVFYSLFILPLHATLSLWPVIAAQALLAAWVLWLVCRTLLPAPSTPLFLAIATALSALTWLPWLVGELMPDLFTPLLILVIALLTCVPQRLSGAERIALATAATCMIGAQQSSLPLACVLFPLLAMLTPSAATISRTRRWLLAALPPILAVLALCTMNLAAHGRFAVSPFGDVFFLARVIYDGPGMAVLRRDCPTEHWRLCPYLDSFPPTSDDFLWTDDSPLNHAGGAKLVSQDAGAIIAAALLASPVEEARSMVANAIQQLTRFASGDGLQPWPAQVSPWIERDFPMREAAAYQAARQQRGMLSVFPPLAAVHITIALIGTAACLALLPVAIVRRTPAAGFLLAVLVSLPLCATITGSLSAPHDRYQSRIMWLPPFIALIAAQSLLAKRPSGVRTLRPH